VRRIDARYAISRRVFRAGRLAPSPFASPQPPVQGRYIPGGEISTACEKFRLVLFVWVKVYTGFLGNCVGLPPAICISMKQINFLIFFHPSPRAPSPMTLLFRLMKINQQPNLREILVDKKKMLPLCSEALRGEHLFH
jgi:hypothetical protein